MKNKIIVDLDGTLINTKEANKLAYEKTFKDLLNIDFDYDLYFGKSFDFISKDLNLTAKQVDEIKNYKKSIYPNFFNKAIVNEELVAMLKDKKNESEIILYTMASKDNTLNILNYFNLSKLFNEIITVEDLQYRKPNIEGFKYILKDCKNYIIYDDDKEVVNVLRKNNFNVIEVK